MDNETIIFMIGVIPVMLAGILMAIVPELAQVTRSDSDQNDDIMIRIMD